MSDKNSPAFPGTESHANDGTQQIRHHLGISRREYFTGQALIGLLANSSTQGSSTEVAPLVTSVAVYIADQVIAELEKVS